MQAASAFMMRREIGLPPIGTVGLGRTSVSVMSRVPVPPARMRATVGTPSS